MLVSFTLYSLYNKSYISSLIYFLSLTSPYVQPFKAFFNSYFLFFLLFNSSSESPISYKLILVISSSLLFTKAVINSNVYVLSSTSISLSASCLLLLFKKAYIAKPAIRNTITINNTLSILDLLSSRLYLHL